jgi:hypothetical protein
VAWVGVKSARRCHKKRCTSEKCKKEKQKTFQRTQGDEEMRGRHFISDMHIISMGRTSDLPSYSFRRQSYIVMFFGGPTFDTGLKAHGLSRYCWIVVVTASRWWSCGVLRSKWGGPKDSAATKSGAADRRTSWYR